MKYDELDDSIIAVESWLKDKMGPKTQKVIDAAKKYRDTLPRTMEMQVYYVEYVFYSIGKKCWSPQTKVVENMQAANLFVCDLKKYPESYDMIKITGPHYRSVPV